MPSGQMHRILGLWEKLWRLDKMENIESLTCIVRGSAAPGCSRVFPGSELQLRRALTQIEIELKLHRPELLPDSWFWSNRVSATGKLEDSCLALAPSARKVYMTVLRRRLRSPPCRHMTREVMSVQPSLHH
mmetsp:Transcript_36326/g.65676  ORF Transcript_36326/g.65676 Transcript_36326/m.65676 type:complete len:131 (-) Transcript_36326:832-1224(-)